VQIAKPTPPKRPLEVVGLAENRFAMLIGASVDYFIIGIYIHDWILFRHDMAQTKPISSPYTF
jgi:hypothetical protein